MRANQGGQIVDAVAIYTGGKTGPDAVAGREIMELVRIDERLPQVVAGIIREHEARKAAMLEGTLEYKEGISNGLCQPV